VQRHGAVDNGHAVVGRGWGDGGRARGSAAVAFPGPGASRPAHPTRITRRARARCGRRRRETTLQRQARRSALPVKHRTSRGAARPQGGGGATPVVPNLQCHTDGGGLPTAPSGRMGGGEAGLPHDIHYFFPRVRRPRDGRLAHENAGYHCSRGHGSCARRCHHAVPLCTARAAWTGTRVCGAPARPRVDRQTPQPS